MKSLKNISLLLAFACAVPVYADEQTTVIDVVAQQTDVAVDQAQVTAPDEQPDVDIKSLLEHAHNYAVAGAAGIYGIVGATTISCATFFATNSLKAALLVVGGGGLASLGLIGYLHNKYKSKLGEKAFKAVQEIARLEFICYLLPLVIAGGTCTAVGFAEASGWVTGLLTGLLAKKAGLSATVAGMTAVGVATVIPTYTEMSSKADDDKQLSTYQKAIQFACVYGKNLAQYALIGAAGATAAAMCTSK